MSLRRLCILLGVSLALGLGACVARQDSRGAVIDPERVAQIKEGETTQSAVRQLMGSPSTTTTFAQSGKNTWYYISKQTESVAFLAEETIDQQVLAIEFDDGSRVKSVRHYGLKDGKEIALVDRVTPTKGKELGVLQQLFGNVGKFNSGPSGPGTGRP